MWEEIQTRNPVWHFDASGCFIKNIPDQSSPLLYSLVCYDPVTRLNLPISDFFSSANDSLSIQLNLIRIKNSFQNHKNNLPSIIVTGFSWANINAILRAFLNCDIIQYLKISYKKCVLKDNSYNHYLKPLIYLCATHFLKNIIEKLDEKLKIRKRNKVNDKVKSGFIFCFSILQNSLTIDEFNDNLQDFFNIFSQKKLNQSLVESLTRMQINISTRKINWLKDCFQFEERKYLNGSSSKETSLKKDVIFTDETSDNYMRDSPFTNYFKDRIADINAKIKNQETYLEMKDNPYFFPELLDILKSKLHLVPLWTGLLISHEIDEFPYKKSLSRLTNNPVEAWFGNLRNNILDINKRVKIKQRLCPSEIVIPLYNQLKMFYEERFKNSHRNSSSILEKSFRGKRQKKDEEK